MENLKGDFKEMQFHFRWISSHFKAGMKIFQNLKLYLNHLSQLMVNPDFKKALEETKEIYDFFIDKKTLLFMVYNLDCESVFTEESLTSQESDATVIGKCVVHYYSCNNSIKSIAD